MNDLNTLKDMRFASSQVDIDLAGAMHGNVESWVGSRSEPVSRQNGLSMRLPRGGQPLVVDSGRRTRHLVAKRVFDVLASAGALIALMPLLAIVALIIVTTSRGPVLFRQEREGYKGRAFLAYKFRSMKVEECDVSGVAQTVRDDPRVTPIGRVLRRTSIDELPQLINVLVGDMSLVGPRPHVAGMRAGGQLYRDLVPYYDYRLEMLPGLTGWAQANGLRGPTDRADRARARVDHDIAYIQNFSFWLDLKIVAMTIRHEFVGGSGH
jgi:lipopolysaccharide/colanic/teichoic acid biosynthesis glycosyltransferase